MSSFIYCYSECNYAECRYAKCRGAVPLLRMNNTYLITLYSGTWVRHEDKLASALGMIKFIIIIGTLSVIHYSDVQGQT